MRRRLTWVLAAALCVCGLHASVRAETVNHERDLSRAYVPAISMDTDRRLSPEDWARNSKQKIGARFGATGLVRCGNATGTAQLTLRNDVITTAAHVLIDSAGLPRTCTFQPTGGGAPVAIDARSIVAGSRMPLSESATRDWAVARLVRPVQGATPYGLASAGAKPGGIFMVAGGNKRADGMGAEQCNARGILASSQDGVREFAIDCSGAPGSSGAALTSGGMIVGIHVGYRSTNPTQAQAFSKTHYNFAITVEGSFRRALLAAAR